MGTKDCFRIHGQVREVQTERGLSGLEIQALDKDLLVDDRLGMATTDEDGRFDIRYSKSDFRDFFDLKPDIYLQVRGADGALLCTTEDKVRYEAEDTEEFLLEIPRATERIADSDGLRRRIVGDSRLQHELADTVDAVLKDRVLLDGGLAYTFVPLVAERPITAGDLFATYLGPQPEPPDYPAWARGHYVNPQPEPPLPVNLTKIFHKPEPDPWVVRWPWIGVPSPELLQRLERHRISDVASGDGPHPARSAEELAYRIMADRALTCALSRGIGSVLSRHGVVLAAGKNYSFVPVVYERPEFAGEAMSPCAAMPWIRDRSGGATAAGWATQLDGIPPPELLRSLTDERKRRI
jgi:hypothetical protein